MNKLIIYLIISLLFVTYSCYKCEDTFTTTEGVKLLQDELNFIPYQTGDTIKFISNDSIFNFYCISRSHIYNTDTSGDEKDYYCGWNIHYNKYDELSVKIITPLSDYCGSKVIGIRRCDSIDIYMRINSRYVKDQYLNFDLIMNCQFFHGSLKREEDLTYYTELKKSLKFDSLEINNKFYYDVWYMEQNYLNVSKDYPFYYDKLYYNAKYGILRILRTDGKIIYF